MDHGAHFYRTDLQVHSPRDRSWTGAACVTDQERKQYAASLIRVCRQKGLQAIAITDHHDLLFAKFVRAAARAERDDAGQSYTARRTNRRFSRHGIDAKCAMSGYPGLRC